MPVVITSGGEEHFPYSAKGYKAAQKRAFETGSKVSYQGGHKPDSKKKKKNKGKKNA